MAGPLPVRPATDPKRVGRQRTSVLSWVIGVFEKITVGIAATSSPPPAWETGAAELPT